MSKTLLDLRFRDLNSISMPEKIIVYYMAAFERVLFLLDLTVNKIYIIVIKSISKVRENIFQTFTR